MACSSQLFEDDDVSHEVASSDQLKNKLEELDKETLTLLLHVSLHVELFLFFSHPFQEGVHLAYVILL